MNQFPHIQQFLTELFPDRIKRAGFTMFLASINNGYPLASGVIIKFATEADERAWTTILDLVGRTNNRHSEGRIYHWYFKHGEVWIEDIARAVQWNPTVFNPFTLIQSPWVDMAFEYHGFIAWLKHLTLSDIQEL